MINKLVVEERASDIGNFLVGRLLPFRQKRQVGPFTFIDHMGPATIGPGKYMDVDQHPHIGLSTLTYLFEGQIEHKDSTGALQIIRPGDVGFMTSGSGVTHTERTPSQLRDSNETVMHGYQIWVALPKDVEESDPQFQYIPFDKLPRWNQGDLELTLVAGRAFGKESPLQVYSPLFMMDLYSPVEHDLDLHGHFEGEIAFVVAKGEVSDGTDEIGQGQMLISKSEDQCKIKLAAGTRLMIFGGQPLPEPRYLYWNFVSSSKERLEKAKQDWREKKFPKVPGDNTYVPLPQF
ncbi:MAG: pirin family protein [Cyclobacteriaceae bacterium]|nr:pirin family protein [Cyclobacteriaceae bacterium]